MTMAWNIEQLRDTGKDGDKVLADMMEWRLKAEGDFDFPEQFQKTESEPVNTIKTEGEKADDPLEVPVPVVLRPLGEVALADSNDISHTELLDELTVSALKLERIPALNAEIQDILAPITKAVKMKMPPYPFEWQRYGLMGRKLIHFAHTEWKYSEWAFDTLLNYNCRINYTPDNAGNRLDKFRIVFGGMAANGISNHYEIELIYKNDIVKSIEFSDTRDSGEDYTYLRSLLTGGVPQLAPKKLNDAGPWDEDILGGSVGISKSKRHMGYTCHTLRLNADRITYNSEMSCYGYSRHEINREYNAVADAFRTSHTTSKTGEWTAGKTIETEKVKQLVHAITTLIPTKGNVLLSSEG